MPWKENVFAIATIDDWEPEPGSVVCWHASPASLTKAGRAPVSPVPASYQQAQHLRRYCDHVARGLDMSRLMIFTWDMAGQCDIRAMTYTIIYAHLRRHDTYRSWFECTDGEDIVRHTIDNPADIKVVPVKHGDMTTTELREHILAPHPLEWDCWGVRGRSGGGPLRLLCEHRPLVRLPDGVGGPVRRDPHDV